MFETELSTAAAAFASLQGTAPKPPKPSNFVWGSIQECHVSDPMTYDEAVREAANHAELYDAEVFVYELEPKAVVCVPVSATVTPIQ